MEGAFDRSLTEKLKKDDLLYLFKTHDVLSPRYRGLVYLIAKITSDDNALLVLNLVEKLPDDYLNYLFLGNQICTGKYEETDNLIRQIHIRHFSPAVVTKALKLLGRIPAGDAEFILLSDEGGMIKRSTPMEMTFAPQNRRNPEAQAALAIAFIDTLSQSYVLRPLLVNAPRPNSEPFLHLLVRDRILPAIAHYLENPKLKIDHTNDAGKTALEIAACGKVACLFKAHPLRKLLLNPNPAAQKNFKILLEKTIREYPGVLASRWGNNKTLAHIAVEQKNPQALALLLRHGADANAKDDNQLSLLDYAINTNQSAAIHVLASCPDTIFTEVRQNGTLPLTQLLGKCDQATMKGIITNLRAKGGNKEAASFASTLAQLPTPRLTNDELKQELEKPALNLSRIQALADYCRRTNDSITYFLLRAGKVVSTTCHPTLIQSAHNFVENHLDTLASGATLLEKDSIRMQLVMFLFAMKPTDMVAFFKQLALNSEQLIQLDVTICHALVQPLIFSSLTKDDHQIILNNLPDPQASLKTIAQIHFRRSKLTLLPPELLQEMSYALPENELYQHSRNRLNPVLIVLTLNRELANTVPNSENILELFKSLEHELMLFNQNPSSLSLDELALMLNLATSPRIQDAIENVIKHLSETAPIKTKIDALFTRFRKGHVLINEGMLRKLFIDLANTPHKTREKNKQAALVDIISVATSVEVRQIVSSQQQAIQPHLLIASLLHTDSSGASSPAVYEFPRELFNLDHATAQIELTPFINRAVAFADEIDRLARKLDGNEYLALTQSIKPLVAAFENLSDVLITSQFENTFPAWTGALEAALTMMLGACPLAIQEMEKIRLLSHATRMENQVLQRLTGLIQEQAASAFPEALKQAFQNLDNTQASKELVLQQVLARSALLKPLQPIFSLKETDVDTSLLPTARKHQTSQVRQQIRNLNNTLRKGIFENTTSEELLPALHAWQMGNGALVTETSLIKQLPRVITGANPAALSRISEQQDAILFHAQKTAPLLASLQRLGNNESSLNDLLDILYTSDNETLAQFVLLSGKAQVHDLNRISQYVLTGKTQHWDIALLKKRVTVCEHIPVASWLTNSLNCLTTVTSHALSIKALIAGHYLDFDACEARLSEFSELVKTHKLPLTLDAITLFANSHATLLRDDLFSSPSRSFVMVFSELLQQSNAELQAKVLLNLPSTFIRHLLEHALAMIGSPEPKRAEANKMLLTCLCQQTGTGHESHLHMIKKRLGAQDFKLLGEDSLIFLAREVLTEKSGLQDATYDGVWIQRLLVSPRFVSACPPETLQSLTERYRALSLTLKQDEFERLNNFISGKLDFANQHREAFVRWQQELLANPEARTRLLEKRERLLMFRADDCIRALYNQLEDNCFELRETDADLANKALDNLYTHHNQQLTSMRSDVLFRMADFIYSRATGSKGDLPKAQSPLLSWLEKHLPHHNFQQAELERKSSVRLYDANGEPIGYLDESNHAKALVNDQPVSLLEVTGWHAGSVLFDDNRQRLGILTATGQLKRENLFQEQTSALLVGRMPISELEKSPAALDLLLQDICNENALSALYQAVDDTEKRAWLYQKVSNHIQENEQPLSDELTANFVTHHPLEFLLEVLGASRKPVNAENLFNAILVNDTKRSALLEMAESPLIHAFFKQGNPEAILTNFLLEHHNKPWFDKGLALITRHTRKSGLLGKSLQKLANRVSQQTLSKFTMDAVLQTLISTPVIARTVLQEGSNIASFFSKQHLMPLVKTLNDKESWQRCPQYELLLNILKAEHERLFPSTEVGLSGHPIWNAEDLQHMTAFVSRHIRTKNNFDADGALGQSLLGELVFRSASFGQTSLFYKKNGKLDARIVSSHIQRSTLDALAARYYLVNYAKESLENFITIVKSWFASTDDEKDKYLDDEFKENHAVIDWKALAKASWSHTHDSELPLIAAFLINYSGAIQPVTELLDDIFQNRSLMKNRTIVHHLAQIMAHYPRRDISHVIFNALMEASNKNPRIIDNTVLDSLVSFHTHAHLKNGSAMAPLEAELSLLTHFGQQKNYTLTGHVAKLLYQADTWGNFFLKCFGFEVSENDEINILFGRAITEARVEGELQGGVGSWFFGFKKTLKRWWHYGIDGMKNPTGIVKFCDDESPYAHTWTLPGAVRSLIPGAQIKQPELEFVEDYARTHERYQAFMNKPTSPKDMPKEAPSPKKPGLDKFGLFAKAKEMWDSPVPNEVPMAGVF